MKIIDGNRQYVVSLCNIFIPAFESDKLVAYKDGGGVWTIGKGTTYYPDGTKVCQGDTCTQEESDYYFSTTLNTFITKVESCLAVNVTACQLAAMTSLAYNIGMANFKSSGVLECINKGDIGGAAANFRWWRKDNGVIEPGLVRRRLSEANLFCGNHTTCIIPYRDFPKNWEELYYSAWSPTKI